MDPIIYAFAKPDKPMETSSLKFEFDNKPSPKLIKFGFNNIAEELDLLGLTSNPHYRAGLNFDFEREDEQSFVVRVESTWHVKNFNKTFAEFWEILTMFGLLENDQTISTSHKKEMENILDLYKKMSEGKKKWNIASAKDKRVTLVVQKYSDADVDENATIQLLIDDLPKLLPIQSQGSSMVLQLFSTQTRTTAEIIYYLASYYNEAYLVKPTVISDLSDSKYLVLIGLNAVPKFAIPKHPKNVYLHTIGLKELPENYGTMIQCFNSEVMPKKYQKYYQIKSYLDTKVYEGATYQDLINKQNQNTEKWISIFGDLSNIKSVIDAAVQKSSDRCSVYKKLANILG